MAADEPAKEQIFREKAYRLYLQNQQKIVVLKLARPQLFPYLWGFLACLALLIAVLWKMEIPVHLEGVGLVLEAPEGSDPTLVSLLPPEGLGTVRTAQKVAIYESADAAVPVLVATITQVEPEVLSPKAAREALSLGEDSKSFVEAPVVLARARIDSVESGLRLPTYVGSRLPIEVEVGRRPVLSLLPGLQGLAEPSEPPGNP